MKGGPDFFPFLFRGGSEFFQVCKGGQVFTTVNGGTGKKLAIAHHKIDAPLLIKNTFLREFFCKYFFTLKLKTFCQKHVRIFSPKDVNCILDHLGDTEIYSISS